MRRYGIIVPIPLAICNVVVLKIIRHRGPYVIVSCWADFELNKPDEL